MPVFQRNLNTFPLRLTHQLRRFSMTAPKPHKRLVVACDGTWVNSDNGFVRDSWWPWKTGGHLANSSNVTRLCRALLPKSTDGVQQVLYYQGGLGSNNNWYSYYIGGFLGEGISENIREGYAFLCNVSWLMVRTGTIQTDLVTELRGGR